MVVLRVVLVDDAALVREGIARLLAEEGIEVAAQLSDARDLTAIEAAGPDVAILDVRMPPTHTTEGLVAALALKAAHPTMGVLVLSQYIETHQALDLLNGTHRGVGYLLKERITRSSELVDAVRRIAAGETVVDPEVVRKVFETPRASDPIAPLTDRERDVLSLVAEGHSNAEIAIRLGLTGRTVETHTSRIFMKLGLEPAVTTHRRVLAVLAHLRASAS